MPECLILFMALVTPYIFASLSAFSLFAIPFLETNKIWYIDFEKLYSFICFMCVYVS